MSSAREAYVSTGSSELGPGLGATGAGGAPTEPFGSRGRPIGADLALLGRQVIYEQRAFWRNRRRALTSFAFPLMFLIIFGAIVHGKVASLQNIPYINFYVPGIIAYAVMVIGFTNMAMAIAYLRYDGILKRLRVTPMPPTLYLLAVVLSNVLTIVAATVLLLVVGVAFYGAHLEVGELPGFALTLMLASACFTSLGIAVARFIPRPDSGMPVLMFVTLPLSFISDVFFPLEKGAHVLREIGEFFPLFHVSRGLQPAFEPFSHGGGLVGSDVLALLVWSAVGLWLSRRTMQALARQD